MNHTSYLLFAACAPGCEPLLAAELADWGLFGEQREGGVELRVTREGLYRVALGSALAEGVRVRLKSFMARDFGALLAGLSRLPWRAYLGAGQTVRVRVTCHRSKLWHSGAVEERVLAVLRDRVGARTAGDAQKQLAQSDKEHGREVELAEDDRAEQATVFVRITGDAVQVSVDACGRMHRRGYRKHVEKASLRETLAATLVHVAEQHSGGLRPSAIWDPFCGAGTVLCEAARRYAGILPGGGRRFCFEDWPTHDAGAFAQFRESWAQERAARTSAAGAQNHPYIEIVGSDRAPRAVDAARFNAELGGVGSLVRFTVGDFEAVASTIARGAWIVTNPPYGERLEQDDWAPRLTKLLKTRKDLRPVVILAGGGTKHGLSSQFINALSTKNGGLDVSVRVLAT